MLPLIYYHLKRRFYEGGGIYRSVTLTIADPLSIVPWGVFLPSAVTGAITSGPLGVQGSQNATGASVMPQTDVQNLRSVAATFWLSSEVHDASGARVGIANTSSSLPPGGSTRMYQEVVLPSPVHLWNTGPQPPLYTVHSTLWVAGVAVDVVTTTIGIRSAVWTPTSGFQVSFFEPLHFKCQILLM